MGQTKYRALLAAAIDTETGREALYANGDGYVISDLNEMTDEQCENVALRLQETLQRSYPTVF